MLDVFCKPTWTIVLVIVFLIIILRYSSPQKCVFINTFRPFATEKIQTYTRMGFYGCSQECISRPRCMSIIYDYENSICQVTSKVLNQSRIIPQGTIRKKAYNRTNLVKQYNRPCDATICNENEKCISTINSGILCIRIECNPPRSSHNWRLMRKSTSRNIGDVVKYECIYNTKIIDVSICTHELAWTKPDDVHCRFNTKYIEILNKGRTHDDAEAHCEKQFGGNLLLLDTYIKVAAFKISMKAKNISSRSLWVAGVYSSQTSNWVTRHGPIMLNNLTYLEVSDGECVALKKHKGLVARRCGSHYGFICEENNP